MMPLKKAECTDIQKLARSVHRVIAIQNFGSSGSKLVHALLDNHPNILTIPTLYMSYFFLNFWPTDDIKKKEEVIEDFILDHEYWFDPKGYPPWGTNAMGPNCNESVYIEKKVFKENLHIVLADEEWVKRKLFFQALYVAYAMSYDRKLELERKDYLIVYPYHLAKQHEAIESVKDFPDTFFLHVWREPVQAFGSSYKIALTRWGGFFNLSLFQKRYTSAYFPLSLFLTDHYVATKTPYRTYGYTPILKEYASHSRAIQLEELVANPKAVLSKFCQWMNIPWSDELLKSTYNGKLWWNRPESARVTGLSHEPLALKHDDIFNRFDQFRLNLLMEYLKKGMGYSNGLKPSNAYAGFLIYLALLFPFKFEFIDILPAKRTLPRTRRFLIELPKNLKTLMQHRKLRGIRLLSAGNEIKRFIVNWLLLVPIRSYVLFRIIMFRAWKDRSRPIEFVQQI